MKNMQIVHSSTTKITTYHGMFSKKLLMLLFVLITVKDDLTGNKYSIANAYYMGRIRGSPNQANSRNIERVLRSYFNRRDLTNDATRDLANDAVYLALLNRANRNAGGSMFPSSNSIYGDDFDENAHASLVGSNGGQGNPDIKEILAILRTKKFRWCGSALPNFLATICRGVYNEGYTNLMFRRDVLGLDNSDYFAANNYAEKTDDDDPDSIIYDKVIIGGSGNGKGGIAQKCCVNSCTYFDMLSFCAKRPMK